MRMRPSRTLPTLLGVALLLAVPVTAAAQKSQPKRVRPVAYHMLLQEGADPRLTDAALESMEDATRQLKQVTSPAGIRAQTPYMPYYGQSKVRYDKFDWFIY